ncbi:MULTISPECIES: hypothetical protein [unclassified Undibacterium]|uniref:hypothetical protein n=1 Tax=unclassified Undibacterium TaxID=2630295 RepID=UPI002AC8A046|nr:MULTISPECIES: hypothetical protein [unclassified Undibacterium]MEB0140177.1 hypothetical protein [Undibacterium sp. CCC2.1]MEB0172449.1 hypothetical protein [Undibacterium sp. CCC1.1]MEB0176967.1 hypothetical protein [Undibacterium sp. CCC3.4]MEB0215571.1 hypothetical protein [Undibacterium sp. 5I2]WPX43722.1 hypothetical protein RHM61_00335 [Undibacterium sp. CCC3.4]
MDLLTQEFHAPANGLRIAVTLNQERSAIRRIHISSKKDLSCKFHLQNDSERLDSTRIQYVSQRGYHIDGSLSLEASEEVLGGMQIRATLRYGHSNEIQHLNGKVIHQFPPSSTEPVLDPDKEAGTTVPQDDTPWSDEPSLAPTNSDSTIPTPTGRTEDLFPYIFLRKWSQPTAAALALAFVQFPAASSKAVFFAALSAQPGLTREQMHSEALLFCAGSDQYSELYVADCSQLHGMILRLPSVARAIAAAHATPTELMGSIPALLYLQASEMNGALNATDYLSNIERVWQSYFAQLILDSDETELLFNYTQLLLTDHLLRALFAPAAALCTADFFSLRKAAILLPSALFPLPPATPISPTDKAAMRVCAIGELKMVRQVLLRYEAGELAQLENIMPGERRETRRSSASGQQHSDTSQQHTTELNDEQAEEARNSLSKQAQQAIAEQISVNKYTDFDTSYGPPTQVKLNGSWTEWSKQGKNPGSDEETEFARNILEKSVSRVTRNVRQVRASGSYVRTEDSVTSTVDNSTSTNKLLCAFRWLNKIFRASVVGHGHRLMIEIMLTQPAASLRQRQLRDQTDNFDMPVSLAGNGINSFAQISPDNYARLAAAYGATDVMPPPAAQKYLSATLCNGERKSLRVPAGYCVNQVFLTYVSEAADANSPTILIGREKFQASDDPTKTRTFGEDDTIALCVLAHAATPAVPAPAPAAAPAVAPSSVPAPSADDPALAPVAVPEQMPGAPIEVLANVIIACEPSPALFDAWRIQTYETLLRGYQQQLEQVRRAPKVAPPNTRKQIRQQLRQACTRLLSQRAAALCVPAAGANDAPASANLIDPWEIQFIAELFEWHQMSAHFYAVSDTVTLQELSSCDDSAWAEFLHADMARILLPVVPAQEAVLLYYLSSGQRWQGQAELAPVDSVNAALVLELKRMQAAGPTHPAHADWEIIVPTTMQIQDTDFSVSPAPMASRT